jgi:hypothetical protein
MFRIVGLSKVTGQQIVSRAFVNDPVMRLSLLFLKLIDVQLQQQVLGHLSNSLIRLWASCILLCHVLIKQTSYSLFRLTGCRLLVK